MTSLNPEPPQDADAVSLDAIEAIDDTVISQVVTDGDREYMEAGLSPVSVGGGELPSQAAADALHEAQAINSQAINSQQVKEKAVTGAKSLGVRTVVSFGLRIISSLTLSHFLVSHDYGLFGVASAIAGLGQYFCDVGMGSVLLMQEKEPTADELTTVFWLQQGITSLIIAAIVLCLPLLLKLYNAPPAAAPILVVMSVSMLFAALRVAPIVQLERSLDFVPQAKAEMLENLAQVVGNLVFAVLHFGPWALVGGSVAGRIVGLVALWYASPWTRRGRFRLDLAKRLVGVGTRFQINILAPIIISNGSPVIITRLLGVGALGLLNWSLTIASVPLLLSGVLNRIAFPALTRLQSDPAEMGRVTSILVRRTSTIMGLSVVPLVIFSPIFVPLVFGRQWTPALTLFQWVIMDNINAITVGLLAQTLSAAGHLTPRLIGAIVGGFARLGFLYIGARFFGLPGIGAGGFLGTLTELAILALFTRKYIAGSSKIGEDIGLPILGMQAVGGAAMLATHYLLGSATPALPLSAATLLHSLLVASAALGIFLTGVALYDILSGRQAVRTEIAGMMRLIQSRKNNNL